MQDQIPPGREPGKVRGSAPVIWRRDDQDDGREGTDEAPTPDAWLTITLHKAEQPADEGLRGRIRAAVPRTTGRKS